MICTLLTVALAAPLSGPVPGPHSTPGTDGLEALELRWDARAVEHLWNRAAFGIRTDEIDVWVKKGPEALVDHLLAPRERSPEKSDRRWTYRGPSIDQVEFEQRTIEERREYRTRIRSNYAKEFARLRNHWIGQMLRREDPLRDRMTLFWHGVFTSSYDNVRHPELIGRQHETLRRHALGSYAEMLRSMLRDPALLIYLNNDENRKGKPNENLAREVMELFSLGQGSGYTEIDVQEAARALTGAGLARRREVATYRFSEKQHDAGEKTILGASGPLGPDDLAEILLDQPACATFIARSLIEYLEGVPLAGESGEARVARYAARLRETNYDLRFFLRALFLDPEFYRDDVVGARIASPVDYLVGLHVRFGGGVPAPFIAEASRELGQDLFRPPNVKGWEEGIAWISTASFMLRGNVAGALVGRIDRKAVRRDSEAFFEDLQEEGAMAEMSAETMEDASRAQARRDAMNRLTKSLSGAKYKPRRSAYKWLREEVGSGASDAAIVAALADRLLAVEPPAETLRMLQGRLESLRLAAGVPAGAATSGLLAKSKRATKTAEPILAEICHLIFSLPEAQLH
ncbi:MAG: DUF1800 domain-containing protein [Planctomycetota bacterium]